MIRMTYLPRILLTSVLTATVVMTTPSFLVGEQDRDQSLVSESDAQKRDAFSVSDTASNPVSPQTSPQVSATQPNGVENETRDPFSITSSTDQLSELGPQFVPSAAQTPVPSIKLRGYIEVADRKPVAIIEIDRHGTFVVRRGDTISLQSRRSDPVLKIRELSGLSVTVEIGTIGQVIVVR